MHNESHTTDVARQLRQRGIFPTGQRLAIAQARLIRHQHATADQLHAMRRDDGEHVSKTTVYNTLKPVR